MTRSNGSGHGGPCGDPFIPMRLEDKKHPGKWEMALLCERCALNEIHRRLRDAIKKTEAAMRSGDRDKLEKAIDDYLLGGPSEAGPPIRKHPDWQDDAEQLIALEHRFELANEDTQDKFVDWLADEDYWGATPTVK